MLLTDKIRHTLKKYSMLSAGDHVLVGLSGGPDSVCLLTVLHMLRPELDIGLSAVYIDHGLRPEEIPIEKDFCSEFCNSLDVPFIVKSIDVITHVKEKTANKQEAARELRYKAFEDAAMEISANRIALGHNADDQAETVIMRLFRGAGASGLSGIPPVRRHFIRPLIEIERNEIEDFLAQNQPDSLHKLSRSFVTDSSNLKDEYLRNKIRHLIIPAIKDLNRDVIKTISRTADILRDEERYFDLIVTKSLMKLITRKSAKTIELFSGPLEATDTVILRRILRRALDATSGLRGISFVHIEDMIHLIKSGNSGDRVHIPGGVRAIKGYATIIITSELPGKLGTYELNAEGDVILTEASIIVRSSVSDAASDQTYGDGKRSAVIDADKVDLPLAIRPRIAGDFFYPLGFGKKKKLQDYFVDGKIPRDERDIVPLVINNGEIVWVVGHRIDERYKVDKSTKRVIKFEIKPLKI